MKNITIYLPEKWIEKFNELSRKGFYPNKSEAIRYLLKQGMMEEGIWDEMMETVRIETKGNAKKTVTKEKALEEIFPEKKKIEIEDYL